MTNSNQNRPARGEEGQFTSKRRANRQSSKKPASGPGRGWHGDSEGHARAGSQSHKNK